MYRAAAFRLIWCCSLALLASCERHQHLVQQHLLEFGTIIEIALISEDLSRAEDLLAAIEQQLRQQRRQWHAWEDSDLSRFNRALQQQGKAQVPPSLVELLAQSQRYYDASDGLFNPALGKLIAAWGFHDGKRDPAAIAEVRANIPGMHDLHIEGNRASSSNPQLRIDLGGIAKGQALAWIGEFLSRNGIENYVVNAGGDLVVAGNRFGRPWRIGIRNPFAPGVIARIELDGSYSLFTSGNYARSYYQGEEFRHHIIDPRNGLPARGQSSATVLTGDPLRADVAATTLMIDGRRRPLELASSLAIDDFLIVSETREILLSRSFAQKVEILGHWPTTIID